MQLKYRKLVYLASPYTHTDPEIREKRFKDVCKAAAVLFSKGYFVFSPIAMTHPISSQNNLPVPYHFWQEFDELMISRSDYFVILKLDGWEKSVGVAEESKFAMLIGKKIHYLDEEKINDFVVGGEADATSASVGNR